VNPIAANRIEVDLEASREDGSPAEGSKSLLEFKSTEIGVWEIEPGVAHDIEIDEVFVVLYGRATVTFADGTPPMELVPGSVVRLFDGQHTEWVVHERLRKVYIA